MNDDAELMLRVKAGDDSAFEILVNRHKRRVINTVHRFLGRTDEAEDLAQDVFLNIYRSAARYEPQAKFTTYLYRIVVNRCINHARRGKIARFFGLESPGSERHPGAVTLEPVSTAPGPEQEAERRQTAETVNRAVLALPERQRLAVILRHYLGMDYAEIGATLSLSLPAVKSILHRGMATLRVNLKGLGS